MSKFGKGCGPLCFTFGYELFVSFFGKAESKTLKFKESVRNLKSPRPCETNMSFSTWF